MPKQGFAPAGVREKIRGYHGASRYSRIKPDVQQQGVKSLNIDLSFEEALKLQLALNSCLHAINRYNRSTTKGRSMGVMLALKTDSRSLAVIEAALRPARSDSAAVSVE